MASATDKPLRTLGELLREKQEPLVLEVYLLERRFAKKIVAAAQERSVCDILKRRKSLPLYFKILKAVSKFLSINETKTSLCKNEGPCYNATPKVHFDAGTFNSCCESKAKNPRKMIKNDQKSATAGANYNYGLSEAIEDVQEKRQNGPNSFHDQDISTDIGDSKLHKVKTNIRPRPHSHRHDSISKPDKIKEDMILSASLSHMLVQSIEAKGLPELKASQFFQMLKSKGILQQKNQLLFDCVREISTNVPCSYDKAQRNTEMLGPEEVGKLICEKLEQWQNQDGDETHINHMLTAEYHNSIEEWLDFKPQKLDIAIEIGDSIFEDTRKEILSEMMQTLGTRENCMLRVRPTIPDKECTRKNGKERYADEESI